MMRKPKAVLTHTVRCLGTGKPEHTFVTDDPAKHRICRRCERAAENLRLGTIGLNVVKQPN